MRPGQQSPRKRRTTLDALVRGERFNEAGATIAPETGVAWHGQAVRGMGFNEAGATIAPETVAHRSAPPSPMSLQ